MSSDRMLRTSWGAIHVAPGETGEPSRLGLAVPARAGGAVQRNRIKRRLRSAFRSSAPSGLDVVIRAGAGAASVDFQELERDMKGVAV